MNQQNTNNKRDERSDRLNQSLRLNISNSHTRRKMSRQQAFDRCATHLIRQGTKSLSDNTPVYQSKDGNKCGAAPCLLNLTQLGSTSVYDLLYANSPLLSESGLGEYSTPTQATIYWMQCIHDEYSPADWARMLRAYAKDNALCDYAVNQAEKTSIKRLDSSNMVKR